MKTKNLIIGIIFVALPMAAIADGKLSNKPLPENITTYLTTHFSDTDVAFYKEKKCNKNEFYNIHLKNGIEIEFDKKGNLTDIDGNKKSIPSSILPTAIQSYLKEKYPEQSVWGIDKKKKNQLEVKLSNGWELLFDKNYQLVNIDD